MTKSLCIIPARSGSKRIKNKNIIKFNNKPLIYWSLRAAKRSNCFDKIVVSSDSKKIIKIAKKYGADTIKRPKRLSSDKIPIFDVVRHYLNNSKIKWSKICCILPSSPLIDFKDIIKCKKKLSKHVKFIFPITNYSYPIDRALIKNKSNLIKFKNKNSYSKNTQKFSTYYHDAGQFYWGFCSDFIKYTNIFDSKKVKGYLIPNYRVRDIDCFEDMIAAKSIFQSLF